MSALIELLAYADKHEAKRKSKAQAWAAQATKPAPVDVPNARTPLEVPNPAANTFDVALAPQAVEEAPTFTFYVFHNADGDIIEIPISDEEGWHAALRAQAAAGNSFGSEQTWKVEGTLQGKKVLAIYTGSLAALRQLWPDAEARKHLKAAGVLGAARFEIVPGTETGDRPVVRRVGHHEPGVASRIERDLR